MSSNQFPKNDKNVPAKPFKLTGRTRSKLKVNDIQTSEGASTIRTQEPRESTPTPSVSSAPGTSSHRKIPLPESATFDAHRRQQMRASSATPTTFNTREEAAAASLMSMREDYGRQSSPHKRQASLSSAPTNQKVRKADEGNIRTSGAYGEQRQGQRPLMHQATPATQPRNSAPPQTNQQRPHTSRQGLNDIRQRLLGPQQGSSAAAGHPQPPFQPTPTASTASNRVHPQSSPSGDAPFYPRDYTGKKIVGKPPSSPAAIAAANHLIAGLKAVRDFAEQEYGFTREETREMFLDATKSLREDYAREKERKKQAETQELAKEKVGVPKGRGSGGGEDGRKGDGQ
ncbi:hypothetical protein KC316_g10239 [Hortaea werneckii]|nr:hypothetical protein KC324_g10183 [Hortaea werneckii]KAI7577599.1 hypothetical protein KC316_g10239 [Hortaea werneckii]